MAADGHARCQLRSDAIHHLNKMLWSKDQSEPDPEPLESARPIKAHLSIRQCRRMAAISQADVRCIATNALVHWALYFIQTCSRLVTAALHLSGRMLIGPQHAAGGIFCSFCRIAIPSRSADGSSVILSINKRLAA